MTPLQLVRVPFLFFMWPDKMDIAPSTYQALSGVAEKLEVTLIVVADEGGYPIVFASNPEILGYSVSDLIHPDFGGLPRLLPPEVKNRHSALMQSLKLRADAGNTRKMGNSKTIKAVGADGDSVDILIDVSYWAPTQEAGTGLFLAFIQKPDNPIFSDVEVAKVTHNLSVIVEQGKKFQRKARRAILKKIAVSGGLLAFLGATLTQLVPIVTAGKAMISSFNLQSPEIGSKIGAVELLSDRQRRLNMLQIRNDLNLVDPSIVAIAYYRLEQIERVTGQAFVLQYVNDTEATNNREAYFEGEYPLSIEQYTTLKRLDCFAMQQAGEFRTRTAGNSLGRFDIVVCPTLKVVKTDRNLPVFDLNNAAMLAVERSPGNKEPTQIEPGATLLFRNIPGFENLIPTK